MEQEPTVREDRTRDRNQAEDRCPRQEVGCGVQMPCGG